MLKKNDKDTGPEAQTTLFEKHFSSLKDLRRTEKGNLQHLMSYILFLTISAMLCGANDRELVKAFGDS